MFDCVMPTRAGRHGMVFTRRGRLNLRNARFADDPRPIDEGSSAPAGRDYSRAYWRHLVKAGEILAMMGLTAINLAYYQDLLAGARRAIAAGELADYAAEVRAGWAEGRKNRRLKKQRPTKRQGGEFSLALPLFLTLSLNCETDPPRVRRRLGGAPLCQSIKRPVLPQTRHFRRHRLAPASFSRSKP